MEWPFGHVIARFGDLKSHTEFGGLTGTLSMITGTFMNYKNLVLSGMAALTLSLLSLPVAAQDAASGSNASGGDAQASAPAPRPEDNWLKVCEPLENGEKACIMRQVVVANNQFLGSFLLRDDPGQESRLLAVAAVPLGVLLPFGLTWQIDGAQPVRVPFMLCDPQSCSTQLVINEAYVNSLKRGAVLKLTAKNRQNQDLVVEINLAGFTKVYDSDTNLTFDQFRQDTTGANALEQVLQDRAEELRRQLGVSGSGDNAGDSANADQGNSDQPASQ